MKCGCSLGRQALDHGIAVIKAKQAVPEYDDIEAIQDAMAIALEAEWSMLSEAGTTAAEAYLAGQKVVTSAHATKATKLLQSPFAAWPSGDAVAMVGDGIAEMYKLSQKVIFNKAAGTRGYGKTLVFKASLEATFSVVDQQAVSALAGDQVYWLGEHYDALTRDSIESAGFEELAGLSGKAAGEKLRKEAERIFGTGAFASKGAWYFSGVAVNAATTARVSGALLELEELGVDSYVIVNPMDERTTDICSDLNGKEFPVKAAADRVREIIAAESPEDVKALHPWNPGGYVSAFSDLGVVVEQGKPITPAAAEVLSAAGYGMPPFHFKCRTTVDLA